MIQKIIMVAITALSLDASNDQKISHKRKADTTEAAEISTAARPVPATHPLDVVTTIKPLQAIILGYMGNLEIVEDTEKKITRLDFGTRRKSFEQEFDPGAYDNLRETFDGPLTRSGPLAACSYDRQLYTTGDYKGIIIRKPQPYPQLYTHVQTITSHLDEDISGLALSPDNKQILVISRPKDTYIQKAYITVRDIATGTAVKTIESSTRYTRARFSACGKYIAYVEPGAIIFIDAGTYKPVHSFPQMGHTFEFSVDGRYIALRYGFDCVRFYQIIQNPLLK